MKNRLLLLLTLFIGLSAQGQLFRAIEPVQPLKIAEKTGGKFATLVKKKRISGNEVFYFVDSDSTGQLPLIAFRYGSIFTDTLSVTYPANFVARFDCGFRDFLTVGTWTPVNQPTKIRRFDNKWWVVQQVDSDPSVDWFIVRGKNFLQIGDQNVTYQTVLDGRCYSQLANQETTNGLELSTNFVTPTGYYNDGGIIKKGISTPTPPLQECITVAGKPTGSTTLSASSSNASPSNTDPQSFGGWVIDEANLSTPQGIDIYISTKYIGTVFADKQEPSTASALRSGGSNVSDSDRIGWRFNLMNVKWWQDGTTRPLEIYHTGTSKRIQFYQGAGVPSVDAINISYNGGGSGICQPPFTSVNLATITPTVQLNASASSLGRSATPFTDSFDYLSTTQMIIGLNNSFGSGPDYVSRTGSGTSLSNQEDSGRQFGIDTYFGSEQPDYYQNVLGWETAPWYGVGGAFPVGYNPIPQGVFNHMVPEPDNFAGPALFKVVENGVHKSTAKTYQYPWAKRNAQGNLEKIDSYITHYQEVSFVKQNVAKFKVRLTVENSMPYEYGAEFIAPDGFISGIRSSPFLFYNRREFTLAKLYEGALPFSDAPLTTFDINTITTDRGQQNWNTSECWIAATNVADTDGIGLVWHSEDKEYGALFAMQGGGTTGPTDFGAGIFYNNRTHNIFKGESIEMTYYIVLGNSAAVRAFAKELHGL